MKFFSLEPTIVVQGNSGRLYEICSFDPPSKSCTKCCFLKKGVWCDNTTVTKEFNASCNCLMSNDKYFRLLEGGL